MDEKTVKLLRSTLQNDEAVYRLILLPEFKAEPFLYFYNAYIDRDPNAGKMKREDVLNNFIELYLLFPYGEGLRDWLESDIPNDQLLIYASHDLPIGVASLQSSLSDKLSKVELADVVAKIASELEEKDKLTEANNNDRTQTPEFRAWFKNSVVVDAQGKPLEVYHGTNEAGFKEFDPNRGRKSKGIFFARSWHQAIGYSKSNKEIYLPTGEEELDSFEHGRELVDGLEISKKYYIVDTNGKLQTDGYDTEEELLSDIELDPGEKVEARYTVWWNDGYIADTVTREKAVTAIDSDVEPKTPGIYAVYLSIQDPLVVDWHGKNWDEANVERVYNKKEEDVWEFPEGEDAHDTVDDCVRQAQDMAFDGVVIHNVIDSGPHSRGDTEDTEYVVFDPKQVKSVYNKGTWNPHSANILEEEPVTENIQPADPTQTPEFKRWFGKSKMVDKQDKPMVFYHGSGTESIKQFDPERAGTIKTSDWGKGIYFTPSKHTADYYRETAVADQDEETNRLYAEYEAEAKRLGTTGMMSWIDLAQKGRQADYDHLVQYEKRWLDSAKRAEQSGKGKVYAVYLKIENPLIYQYEGITDPTLPDQAKAHGNDGIIIVNEVPHGAHLSEYIDEVIVFDSKQIKSVNATEFNPNSADIYEADMQDNQHQQVIAKVKANPNFKSWFSNSKVVDKNGDPKVCYHGTSRADRIGNRFQKSRATAGPMAYFTESPEIASGYTAKTDTSINHGDYDSLFSRKGKKGFKNIWWSLTPEQQRELTKALPEITRDDNDTILREPGRQGGPTSKQGWDYNMQQNRGNALQTAADFWLTGGMLYGEEERFQDVLALAGLSDVEFDNPNLERGGVYPVFLSIQKPLVTTELPQDVITALEQKAKRQPTYPGAQGSMWDKEIKDPQEWIDELHNGEGLVWAVIPDWVTKVLKSKGYDGIQDVGGKLGGFEHTVWIPFEENQVKSIFNKGTFGTTKNISASTDYEKAADHRDISGLYTVQQQEILDCFFNMIPQ